MFIHTVQFESTKSESEVIRIGAERADRYRAVPGLVQKYYTKLEQPNHWAGVMLWESRDAIAAFAQTELAQTVAEAYGVKGAPRVQVLEVFDTLRQPA